MTEAEWLACTDPTTMLKFLRGKASERKLRLFAVACCRRACKLVDDECSQQALMMVEAHADAEASYETLDSARRYARRAVQAAYRQESTVAGVELVLLLCEEGINRMTRVIELAARCEAYPIEQSGLAGPKEGQLHFLWDIFGNPFRLVPLDPCWQTPNVVALAQAAYEQRALPSGELDTARLAVMADTLEDAGCTNADTLTHLRGPGPHVRGCWALDLVLGKR